MSWVICDLTKQFYKEAISDHELESLMVSSNINYFQMQESNEITRLDMEYTDENELIATEYDAKLENVDPNSQEYVNISREKLAKQQENDNKHTAALTKIQNDTDRKINPLETRKEQLEATIKDERAQYETWKEATSNDVEKECAYFNR